MVRVELAQARDSLLGAAALHYRFTFLEIIATGLPIYLLMLPGLLVDFGGPLAEIKVALRRDTPSLNQRLVGSFITQIIELEAARVLPK